jgi:hypothetical protein
MNCHASAQIANSGYDGPVDDKVIAACRLAAGAWSSLADKLEATTANTAALVENAPPPDVGADNMRAQIAALDDGLDIPESLRRTPKAAG